MMNCNSVPSLVSKKEAAAGSIISKPVRLVSAADAKKETTTEPLRLRKRKQTKTGEFAFDESSEDGTILLGKNVGKQ